MVLGALIRSPFGKLTVKRKREALTNHKIDRRKINNIHRKLQIQLKAVREDLLRVNKETC